MFKQVRLTLTVTAPKPCLDTSGLLLVGRRPSQLFSPYFCLAQTYTSDSAFALPAEEKPPTEKQYLLHGGVDVLIACLIILIRKSCLSLFVFSFVFEELK